MNPNFWRERLASAEQIHHSVFRAPQNMWERIGERHRHVLSVFSGPFRFASILDVGCGYGALLDLLPKGWKGAYTGIDLSPDMVVRARTLHKQMFRVYDIRQPYGFRYKFAIMRSFRKMVQTNCDAEVWRCIQANVEACSEYQLYLEYEPNEDEWSC